MTIEQIKTLVDYWAAQLELMVIAGAMTRAQAQVQAEAAMAWATEEFETA